MVTEMHHTKHNHAKRNQKPAKPETHILNNLAKLAHFSAATKCTALGLAIVRLGRLGLDKLTSSCLAPLGLFMK